MFVNIEEVSANVDVIKSFPKKFWAYKTYVMKEYGLSRNQIETAIALGIVRFKNVKNPHYRTGPEARLLAIPDIESNIERIRSFSKYSAKDQLKRHEYSVRKKLRKTLTFFCPRCLKSVSAPRSSHSFEEALYGDKEIEDVRKRLIILHYMHVHTDYEKEKYNVDRWLKPNEIKILTNDMFKSFRSFIEWYEDN